MGNLLWWWVLLANFCASEKAVNLPLPILIVLFIVATSYQYIFMLYATKYSPSQNGPTGQIIRDIDPYGEENWSN